jgi:hypothetical protein
VKEFPRKVTLLPHTLPAGASAILNDSKMGEAELEFLALADCEELFAQLEYLCKEQEWMLASNVVDAIKVRFPHNHQRAIDQFGF